MSDKFIFKLLEYELVELYIIVNELYYYATFEKNKNKK